MNSRANQELGLEQDSNQDAYGKSQLTIKLLVTKSETRERENIHRYNEVRLGRSSRVYPWMNVNGVFLFLFSWEKSVFRESSSV